MDEFYTIPKKLHENAITFHLHCTADNGVTATIRSSNDYPFEYEAKNYEEALEWLAERALMLYGSETSFAKWYCRYKVENCANWDKQQLVEELEDEVGIGV